ncbi:redox-active disulfide protein 2 [Flavobacterium sp.]|uniref:redox-active disulfide protein 2 n=1 Tax=Flavobacterium sp. TaxID=239 RepID=UPI003919E172
MKKEPELSTLTVEELEKRAKTTKIASGFLLGVLLVQFAVGVYLTFQQRFNVFVIIPVAFLPLIILNFNNLKKIKEEIAKRNS